MLFSEFKDWLLAQDALRGGSPPDLVQWWELKARLEAVTGVVASSPGSRQPTPAPTAPSQRSVQAETTIEDCPPPADLDPEPADFRALSREKDGGLSAEAVAVLRGARAS